MHFFNRDGIAVEGDAHVPPFASSLRRDTKRLIHSRGVGGLFQRETVRLIVIA